jgi:hypothetical protein
MRIGKRRHPGRHLRPALRRVPQPLVVGVELEKTVPGDTAAQHLGAAAWTDHEGADAKFMWPYMFDRVADEYDRRYGLDDAHLRAIAQLNFATPARIPTRRPAIGRCPIR